MSLRRWKGLSTKPRGPRTTHVGPRTTYTGPRTTHAGPRTNHAGLRTTHAGGPRTTSVPVEVELRTENRWKSVISGVLPEKLLKF